MYIYVTYDICHMIYAIIEYITKYILFFIGDPKIFSDEVFPIVQTGKIALNQPPPLPLKEEDLDNDDVLVKSKSRSFNFEIAELLLLMSALIYERNEGDVRDAYDMIEKLTDNKRVTNEIRKDLEDIHNKFFESETKIRKQALQWDLNFTALSGLNSWSGPFSGIFYSEVNEFHSND